MIGVEIEEVVIEEMTAEPVAEIEVAIEVEELVAEIADK
jgi:hypothetical protein